MKILAIISLIIVILDVLSTIPKYLHDRIPRPAWKKDYAVRFALLSIVTDAVILSFIILVLRGK